MTLDRVIPHFAHSGYARICQRGLAPGGMITIAPGLRFAPCLGNAFCWSNAKSKSTLNNRLQTVALQDVGKPGGRVFPRGEPARDPKGKGAPHQRPKPSGARTEAQRGNTRTGPGTTAPLPMTLRCRQCGGRQKFPARPLGGNFDGVGVPHLYAVGTLEGWAQLLHSTVTSARPPGGGQTKGQ